MRICKVEGCGRKHDSKGYCIKHYMQIYHYGKILKRTRRDSNEIVVKGKVAEIVLYNIKSKEVARTVIDSEDVEKVKDYKWRITPDGYVVTSINGRLVGIQYIIKGTRFIKTRLIDHKDRTPLNNRKSNLRFCTYIENGANSRIRKDNTSGYKGVSWNKAANKWLAAITVNKKQFSLGYFTKKLDAARAYSEAALKYHKEFACLK